MRTATRLGLILCLLSTMPAAPAWGRKWTDRQGNSMEAKFVRVHEGNVVLMRGNKVVTVPLADLSESDQEYVRQEMANPGQAAESKDKKSGLPPALRRVSPDPEPASPREPAATPATNDSAESARTWTDQRRRKIFAKYVRCDGINVVLLKDGQELTVPLASLIPVDQAYVRSRMQQMARGGFTPPTAPNPASQGSGQTAPNPSVPQMSPQSGATGGSGSSTPSFPTPNYGPSPGGAMGSGTTAPWKRPEFPAPGWDAPDPDGMPGGSGSSSSAPPAGSGPTSPPAYTPYTPPPVTSSPVPTRPPLPAPTFVTPPPLPPTPSPPSFPSSVSVCGKCRKEIPANLGAGDCCPHCQTFFAYEEDEHGKRRYASGGNGWRLRGRSVGKLIVGVITLFAALIGWVVRKLSQSD